MKQKKIFRRKNIFKNIWDVNIKDYCDLPLYIQLKNWIMQSINSRIISNILTYWGKILILENEVLIKNKLISTYIVSLTQKIYK